METLSGLGLTCSFPDFCIYTAILSSYTAFPILISTDQSSHKVNTFIMATNETEYPCRNSHVHALNCGHWIKTKEITGCQSNCQNPNPGIIFLCLRCLIADINQIAKVDVEQLYKHSVQAYQAANRSPPSFVDWFQEDFLTGTKGLDTETFIDPVLQILSEEECEPIDKYEVNDELAAAMEKLRLDMRRIAEQSDVDMMEM